MSDEHDPEAFKEKLRYWRENGGLPARFTYGKAKFHGPTIKERQDRIIAEARANGKDPVPARSQGNRY